MNTLDPKGGPFNPMAPRKKPVAEQPDKVTVVVTSAVHKIIVGGPHTGILVGDPKADGSTEITIQR